MHCALLGVGVLINGASCFDYLTGKFLVISRIRALTLCLLLLSEDI